MDPQWGNYWTPVLYTQPVNAYGGSAILQTYSLPPTVLVPTVQLPPRPQDQHNTVPEPLTDYDLAQPHWEPVPKAPTNHGKSKPLENPPPYYYPLAPPHNWTENQGYYSGFLYPLKNNQSATSQQRAWGRPKENPIKSKSRCNDAFDLAPRPDTWRVDYIPPHQTRLLCGRVSRRIREIKSTTKRPNYKLSPMLEYSSKLCPIGYDIRTTPNHSIIFFTPSRPTHEIDFLQLATNPPKQELTLFHVRLPWYIHIRATCTSGITIKDVLTQIHDNIMQTIESRDIYNVVLDASDREEMTTAYHYRMGSQDSPKLRRMDFLGMDIVFMGLAKGENGRWEIKTALAPP